MSITCSYYCRCYNIIYFQYHNYSTYCYSLNHCHTSKLTNSSQFLKCPSKRKLCTLNLKRLKEDTVLLLRDNRFHIMGPIIFIENLRVLVLAKLGLKFASERK